METEIIIAIITGVLTILSTALALFKNKGKNILDKNQQILMSLPTYIAEAERVFKGGNGSIKLMYVITKATQQALDLKVSLNIDNVVKQIEDILNTPQRKEVTENGGTGQSGDTSGGNEGSDNTEQPATSGTGEPGAGDRNSETNACEPVNGNKYPQIYG